MNGEIYFLMGLPVFMVVVLFCGYQIFKAWGALASRNGFETITFQNMPFRRALFRGLANPDPQDRQLLQRMRIFGLLPMVSFLALAFGIGGGFYMSFILLIVLASHWLFLTPLVGKKESK